MDESLKRRLTTKEIWIRLIFMIVYLIVNRIIQVVVWIFAAAQFLFTIFTGKPNDKLLSFSEGLTRFSFQIMQYLTYNQLEKPYPFAPWPNKQA